MNATGASACFSMALNSACVTFTPTGSCLPFKDTVPSLVAVCDGAVDSVISFAMRNLNVSGTLPSQIGLLTALTSFAVAFCDVHGTVPSQLGELTNLQALRLFENALSGTLPAEMAKMTSLRDLYIDQNAFSGDLSVLPDELALCRTAVRTRTVASTAALFESHVVVLHVFVKQQRQRQRQWRVVLLQRQRHSGQLLGQQRNQPRRM